MKKLTAIIISALTFSVNSVFAQTTGLVEYKALGISFTIPEGWIGQEMQGGYLIGSNTEPGFVLLSTHQYKTTDQLRQMAQQGIFDQNGTALSLSGNLEVINQNSVGGEFQGTIEGQQVKSYIISVVNLYGDGVTIMTAVSPELYTAVHRNLAVQLANSIRFFKPESPPVVDQWKQQLNNAKLTYMDSYYSSGSSYGGYSTGGGYNSKEEIHLCGQGYFKYVSSSSMSIDTGGAFGNSAGGGQGNGSWEVVGNAQGGATLRLNFHNGEVYEYTLDYQDNKTLLNGKRYFRTYANEGAEYAPDCY